MSLYGMSYLLTTVTTVCSIRRISLARPHNSLRLSGLLPARVVAGNGLCPPRPTSTTAFIHGHQGCRQPQVEDPRHSRLLWLSVRTAHPPPSTKISSRNPKGVRRLFFDKKLNLFKASFRLYGTYQAPNRRQPSLLFFVPCNF